MHAVPCNITANGNCRKFSKTNCVSARAENAVKKPTDRADDEDDDEDEDPLSLLAETSKKGKEAEVGEVFRQSSWF